MAGNLALGLQAGAPVGQAVVNAYLGTQKNVREQEQFERERKEYEQQQLLDEIAARNQARVGTQQFDTSTPAKAAAIQQGLQYGPLPEQEMAALPAKKYSDLDYMRDVRAQAGTAGIGGTKVNKMLTDIGHTSAAFRTEDQAAKQEQIMQHIQDVESQGIGGVINAVFDKYNNNVGEYGKGEHAGKKVAVVGQDPSTGALQVQGYGADGKKIGDVQTVDPRAITQEWEDLKTKAISTLSPEHFFKGAKLGIEGREAGARELSALASWEHYKQGGTAQQIAEGNNKATVEAHRISAGPAYARLSWEKQLTEENRKAVQPYLAKMGTIESMMDSGVGPDGKPLDDAGRNRLAQSWTTNARQAQLELVGKSGAGLGNLTVPMLPQGKGSTFDPEKALRILNEAGLMPQRGKGESDAKYMTRLRDAAIQVHNIYNPQDMQSSGKGGYVEAFKAISDKTGGTSKPSASAQATSVPPTTTGLQQPDAYAQSLQQSNPLKMGLSLAGLPFAAIVDKLTHPYAQYERTPYISKSDQLLDWGRL